MGDPLPKSGSSIEITPKAMPEKHTLVVVTSWVGHTRRFPFFSAEIVSVILSALKSGAISEISIAAPSKK
jgi:hypothetical protein